MQEDPVNFLFGGLLVKEAIGRIHLNDPKQRKSTNLLTAPDCVGRITWPAHLSETMYVSYIGAVSQVDVHGGGYRPDGVGRITFSSCSTPREDPVLIISIDTLFFNGDLRNGSMYYVHMYEDKKAVFLSEGKIQGGKDICKAFSSVCYTSCVYA